MHDLARLALLGTARRSGALPPLGEHLDDLLASLDEQSAERRLLLAGGAWAVASQAAGTTAVASEVPTAAEVDPRPVCSAPAEGLLQQLLQQRHHALVVDAVCRLHAAGQRLPPSLLPLALDAADETVRDALRPLLGPRAHWLAQHNSDWGWALGHASAGLPIDADLRWSEGTHSERLRLLKRVRAVDPARALAWLEVAWPDERAADRTAFLNALRIGLSSADEAFLERARERDRATSVRALAADLLIDLPGTPIVERMFARATPCLRVNPTPTGLRLAASAPAEHPSSWAADGLPPEPKAKPPLWPLRALLARVPPARWPPHFGHAPAALVASLSPDELEVAEGWTRAALRFGAADWAMPLWSWWVANPEATSRHRALFDQLPKLADPESVVPIVVARLEARDQAYLLPLLAALPTPWPIEVATAWLAAIDHVVKAVGRGEPQSLKDWRDSLALAARGLPIATAPADTRDRWPMPEDAPRWHARQWTSELDRFSHILLLRQRIAQEFPS